MSQKKRDGFWDILTEVDAVKVQERKANLDELCTAQGRCALSVSCVVCSQVRAIRRQVFVQDTPRTHFLRHEDSPTACMVESSVVTSHVAARGCIFPWGLGRIFCNHGVPVACTSGESNRMMRGLEPFVEACCSFAGGGYLAKPLLVSGGCQCRAPRHAQGARQNAAVRVRTVSFSQRERQCRSLILHDARRGMMHELCSAANNRRCHHQHCLQESCDLWFHLGCLKWALLHRYF